MHTSLAWFERCAKRMKAAHCLLVGLLLVVPGLSAEKKPVSPDEICAPIEPPAGAPAGRDRKSRDDASTLGQIDPKARKTVEFVNDPTDLVLRVLARQARINIFISPEIRGTVTLRLEYQTPMEIINVIAQTHGFVIEKRDDVYYVGHKDERLKAAAERRAQETKLLFDALVAEKFTREEAMQFVFQNELRKVATANEKPVPSKK